MIGGAPILPFGQGAFFPGQFPQAQPVAPPAHYGQWPVPRQTPPRPMMPTTAAMANGQGFRPAPQQPVTQQPAPAPIIRFQNEDPAPVRPTRLELPAPEQLGIRGIAVAQPTMASAPSHGLDWNRIHERLRRLGALGFHLDRLPMDAVRVTFYLPSGEGGRTRLVEAEAASDAQAISLALERAEGWAAQARR